MLSKILALCAATTIGQRPSVCAAYEFIILGVVIALVVAVSEIRSVPLKVLTYHAAAATLA